jgi:3-hydroxyacyl-CoA dehydrogenase
MLDAKGVDVFAALLDRPGMIGSFPLEDVERVHGFLKKYLDRGHLGVKSGRGFYAYPEPAYKAQGFLWGLDTEIT